MTFPCVVWSSFASALNPQPRFFWAWIALCLALALHIIDEALTGFLSVYNLTVRALRKDRPWLPFPVFTFGIWLAGLVAATVALSCLSVFVLRGSHWMRPLAYAFALIMLANGLGHVVGTIAGRTVKSIRFPRPMPGFYSSPLLLVASAYLFCQL